MSIHALTGEIPRLTIADRVSLARHHAGLEQGQLAERLGIARNTISNYEDRKYMRRRNPLYLRAIARACGVDETWLIQGVELTPGPGAPTTDAKSDGQITG